MKKALAAVLAAVLLVPAIAFAADDKVIKVGVHPLPAQGHHGSGAPAP